MIEKDIDVYRSRQDQIEIIEKRRTLKKAIKNIERKKEDEEEEEDPSIRSYKRYKAKEGFDSALNNELQKAKQQKPIKRKSERNECPEVGEEEDEDTEEVFRQIRETGPKKFYRNTDDDSEVEESEASVILITPNSSRHHWRYRNPVPAPTPPSSPIPTPPIVYATAYVTYSGRHKILHDDND
jgi:hypothetical protein